MCHRENKRDGQQVHKEYSTLLIRKCKSKPQGDNHLSSFRMATIKKIRITSARRMERKYIITVGRNVNCCSHYSKYDTAQKLKIKLPCVSGNSTSGNLFKEDKITN